MPWFRPLGRPADEVVLPQRQCGARSREQSPLGRSRAAADATGHPNTNRTPLRIRGLLAVRLSQRFWVVGGPGGTGGDCLPSSVDSRNEGVRVRVRASASIDLQEKTHLHRVGRERVLVHFPANACSKSRCTTAARAAAAWNQGWAAMHALPRRPATFSGYMRGASGSCSSSPSARSPRVVTQLASSGQTPGSDRGEVLAWARR